MDRCPYCNANISNPYRTSASKEEEKKTSKIKDWYTNMDWSRFFSNLWKYTINMLIVIAIVLSLGVIGFFGYKISVSPNKINYCFIKSNDAWTTKWFLIGHVDWLPNRNLGEFVSVAEAQQYAIKINCPLDLTPNVSASSSAVQSISPMTSSSSGQ